MPLNRAPFNALVDDDGSNTTGTPWNKAQIAGVVLDPVDAALATFPAGTFVVTDASGAGLALTNKSGLYVKVGQLVLAQIFVTWPVTANGAVVALGGLPFVVVGPPKQTGSVGYNEAPVGITVVAGGTVAELYHAVGGAGITNAQMSGKTLLFSLVYQAVP